MDRIVPSPHHPSFSIPFPLAILLLIAVAVSLYLPALKNGFVFDDRPLLLGGEGGGEPGAWHRDFTRATYGFYRPLRSVSFRLDRAFWGFNPFGFHLGGLLLHALVGVAFFSLLLSLRVGPRAALAAALLFLAHPANTEAVEYISSRAELLGTLFALLFLLASLRSLRRGEKTACALALVFLLAALLSKESFVILSAFPFFLKGRTGKRKGLIAGSMALAAVFILARLFALPGGTDAGRFETLIGYPQILIKAPAVLLSYLRLLLFPAGLNPDHPLAILPLPGPFRWAGQVLLLLALLVFAAARGRAAGAGKPQAAWFLLSLIPLANLYPAPRLFAEKYLYFPSLWFCLLFSSSLDALRVFRGSAVPARSGTTGIGAGHPSHKNIKTSPKSLRSFLTKTPALISAFILACFALLTLARHPVWRSDLALWASAAQRRPASPLTLFNRGTSLLESGSPRGGLVSLMEADGLLPGQPLIRERIGDAWSMLDHPGLARAAYAEALAHASEPGILHLKLAAAYNKLGDPDRAAESFQLALAHPPSAPGLYRLLDLAGDYRRLAAYYRSRGETEKGRLLLRQALAVFPRDPEVLRVAGYDLLREGKAAAAGECLERARREAGDRPDLLFLLGECRRALGRLGEAESLYREAAAADPGLAAARLALGSVLIERGEDAEAEAAFREGLALAPEDWQSWTNLGNLYQGRGDFRRAEESYLASLSRRDSFKARYNLGFLYLKRLGEPGKALPQLKRARDLCDDPGLRPRIEAAIQDAETAARQTGKNY